MLSTFQKRLFGFGAILGAIGIIALGITKPDPFAEKHVYWAVFDTAHGLGAIDRDVRVAGVKVGTIGEVVRVGDDARAELILNQEFVVHADARADMRPHTLFEGSNFIDFFPGSPSAPVLEEGATIPETQTSSYVTLDEALRVLRPEIRKSLRDLAEVGARTFKAEAIEGLQRTLKAAPQLMQHLEPTARALQGPNRTELAGAIGGIADTVDAVAESEDELIPLMQRLNETMAALTADGGAPLDATLVALPPALRELYDSAPAVTMLVDRLNTLAGEINPALPELTLAVGELTPPLEASIPVLADAAPLIRNTRLLTDRIGNAAPGLIEMFDLLTGPLRQFSDALELFNAPSIHGAPATRQLVAGAFTAAAGAFSNYQTPAQNPVGSGHLWQIGSYISPNGGGVFAPLFGGAAPTGEPFSFNASCDSISQVDLDAARILEEWGGCS
jgi:ABC-type transporter Mla subunit MlaD